MAEKKVDGIIEAVRYSPRGEIVLVRAFERRGAAWSDHVLIGRAELLARLRGGKRFASGQRQLYKGSAFTISAQVVERGKHIVTASESPKRDLLEGVPLF